MPKTHSNEFLRHGLETRLHALRSRAQTTRDRAVASTLTADKAVQCFEEVAAWRTYFALASGNAELVAYVREQYRDAGLDLASQMGNINTAALAVGARLISSLPTVTVAAKDYVGTVALNTDGTTTQLTFSAAQTATLAVDLLALINAIEATPFVE